MYAGSTMITGQLIAEYLDSVDPDVHPNRGFSRSEYAIHDRKNHAEWRKNHERKYNLVARHNGAGKVG